MELTTTSFTIRAISRLFVMSKIQNLNGTHNIALLPEEDKQVVCDVKDTKFEWNSQRLLDSPRY